MEREEVEKFLGKAIVLVLNKNDGSPFYLSGVITELGIGDVKFTTRQKSAWIDRFRIKDIKPRDIEDYETTCPVGHVFLRGKHWCSICIKNERNEGLIDNEEK